MTKPWWQQPFRIFQTNLREIDAALNVHEVLDDLQSFHASAWLLNTGGIVSFYPSRLPYQHPSPWLKERPSGDLVGDAVEEAHRRGVRVISRFDFSKLHQDLYEKHPDWFFVNSEGQPQVYNGLYSTCPSGAYNQELSFEVLGEVLDQYPIDGIFFNMFGFAPWDYSGRYHGICQCQNCQRRFRQRYGLPLPLTEDPKDPAWVDYQEFKQQTAHQLSARMREFIHQKRPDVALVLFMNAGKGDVVLHEINNAIQRPLPYWSQHTGEMVKLSQGEYPGLPVAINSVLFLDIPYRFAAEQPGYIGLRLAQMMAHGANPYVYVIGTTRQPDRRNHAVVRDLYAYHAAHASTFEDLRPVGRTALVMPRRSEGLLRGGKNFETVTAAFRGFYRALSETHAQFEVFYESSLARPADELRRRYDLLILPNAACLSDAEGRAVDDFVRAGGRVIATFETGQYNVRGEKREKPALECLGVEAVTLRRADMRSAVLKIRPQDRAFLRGLEETDLLPLLGEYLYVQPSADSAAGLALVPPMRYGPPEKCYWDLETDLPGVIWSRLGEGQAAYLPWQPDRYYYSLCLPEYRLLLGGLARLLGPSTPEVETDAGPQVEIILRDQAETGRRVVSLVNYSGQNGRNFFDPVEMRNVWVSVAVGAGARRVWATRLGQNVPFEAKDGRVEFCLPSLGLMERVVIE